MSRTNNHQKTKTTTCYMCDAIATSKEHVPPKCIFPQDQRKNLITVYSCEEHNNEKTGDDEYLRDLIAFSLTSDVTRTSPISRKAVDSYKKRHAKRALLKDLHPIVINGIMSGSFTADIVRVNKIFEHISRGLYFKQNRAKYLGDVLVVPYFLGQGKRLINLISDIPDYQYQILSPIFRPLASFGANPNVFTYKELISPTAKTLGYWLTFYAGSEVFVGFDEHYEELERLYGKGI